MAQASDALFRTYGVRANIFDAHQRFVESAVEWDGVVALSPETERPQYRILRSLALAQTDRFAEAVAEAISLAEDAAVRDHAQYLWNLAKICSLAIASSERDTAQRATNSKLVETYVTQAQKFLTRSKAAAKHELWSQLAAEMLTDAGFERLRAHGAVDLLTHPD